MADARNAAEMRNLRAVGLTRRLGIGVAPRSYLGEDSTRRDDVAGFATRCLPRLDVDAAWAVGASPSTDSSQPRARVGGRQAAAASSTSRGVPGGIRRYLSNLAFQLWQRRGQHHCGQIGINEGGSSYGYGTFLALLRRGRRRHVACRVRLARKDVALSL